MRGRNNLNLGPTLLSLLLAAPGAGWAAKTPAPPDPLELLNAALTPSDQAYEGKMTITHWYGKKTQTEDAKFIFDPPNHYRVEFLDPTGVVERIVVSDGTHEMIEFMRQRKAVKGDAIKSGSKLMSEDVEKDLLLKNYKPSLIGTDKVVGRPTWELELIPNAAGKEHQKLWIDQQTHVVLESKRYRPNGAYTVRSQFTQFEVVGDLPDDIFQTVPDTGVVVEGSGISQPDFLTMAELERAIGKPLNLPQSLPGGFQFESGDFFMVKGHTVPQVRYTDGLAVISLFVTDQPVRMPRGDSISRADTEKNLSPAHLSSAGRIIQWKSGDRNYTMISGLSEDLAAEVTAALGRTPAPGASALSVSASSATAGGKWSKITGTVDAFDAASRQLRLKDKTGKLETFTLQDDTDITRNKLKLSLSDIHVGDKVKLLRYDQQTLAVRRLILAAP